MGLLCARESCRVRVRVSFWPYRARQLYMNISMLFLFPVKDGTSITQPICPFICD